MRKKNQKTSQRISPPAGQRSMTSSAALFPSAPRCGRESFLLPGRTDAAPPRGPARRRRKHAKIPDAEKSVAMTGRAPSPRPGRTGTALARGREKLCLRGNTPARHRKNMRKRRQPPRHDRRRSPRSCARHALTGEQGTKNACCPGMKRGFLPKGFPSVSRTKEGAQKPPTQKGHPFRDAPHHA